MDAITVDFYARGLYPFAATNPGDLPFAQGDIIHVLKKIGDGGWWEGEIHGQRGIFPSTYIQICDAPSVPAPKLPPRPQSISTPQFQQPAPVLPATAPAVPTPYAAPVITVTSPTTATNSVPTDPMVRRATTGGIRVLPTPPSGNPPQANLPSVVVPAGPISPHGAPPPLPARRSSSATPSPTPPQYYPVTTPTPSDPYLAPTQQYSPMMTSSSTSVVSPMTSSPGGSPRPVSPNSRNSPRLEENHPVAVPAVNYHDIDLNYWLPNVCLFSMRRGHAHLLSHQGAQMHVYHARGDDRLALRIPNIAPPSSPSSAAHSSSSSDWSVILTASLTCVFRSYDYRFLFCTEDRSEFYVVSFYENMTHEEADQFEDLVEQFSFCQSIEADEVPAVSHPTETEKNAKTIEKAGTAVGSGLVSGAMFLGKGMRAGVDFYKDHSEKGAERQVTEEERRRVEKRQQTAQKVAKGTSTVVSGIGTGLGYVGKGIMYTYDKAAPKSDDSKPKDPNSKTEKAKTYGKSGIAAVGNVMSGAKQATVVVATDVRESSAAVKEHKEGAQAADLTRARFNTVGDAGLAGYHVVSVTGMGVVSVGIGVAKGAAGYDSDKKSILAGPAWFQGFVKWRGDVYKGEPAWADFFAVARAYTVSFYKTPDDARNAPDRYVRLMEIFACQRVPDEALHAKWSFKLVTKSAVLLLSLEVSNAHQTSSQPEQAVECWVNVISALAALQNPNFKN